MNDKEYNTKAEQNGWREAIKEITEKLQDVPDNLQNVQT